MSPWERRERGGLYYTRSHKVDGRVVREYVGGGIVGELAARMDAEERSKREEEAAAWREERERLEGLASLLDVFCKDVETLMRAALIASGFRRHKRGEWRKRRDMAREVQTSENEVALQPYRDRPVGRPAGPDISSMAQDEREAYQETVEKLGELVKKADKGTKKAVPEIRKILNEHPHLSWKLADLARASEKLFIEKMSREEDLVSKETIKRQLACMREEIAGDNPSPLERLLAERVAATWLQVQLFEGIYASSMSKSMTIAQADYQQKRIDKAHRRHLSAVKSLAQIRKMGPTVQINIAEKQINTAGQP